MPLAPTDNAIWRRNRCGSPGVERLASCLANAEVTRRPQGQLDLLCAGRPTTHRGNVVASTPVMRGSVQRSWPSLVPRRSILSPWMKA